MKKIKKLKVGVIGLGAIGNTHVDAYIANATAAEITAVCDMLPERVKTLGDKCGAQGRFNDYRELLKSDVDAVSVCVGNTLHREVAVAALRAGKHVLLEKPMAMNAREAAEIVATAGRSRRVLQIGMVRRQNGDVQAVRRMVANGEFGKIYHMRAVMIRRRGIPGMGGWFTNKAQSGGGPLIDLGVHWFDVAMHVSGLWKPTSVSAATYSNFTRDMRAYKYVSMWAGPPKLDGVCDVEDYATGLVRFGREATMSFEIAWAANLPDQSYVEIAGEKAGVRLFENAPLRILTETKNHPADISPLIPDAGNTFQSQARLFLAACRGECPPAATGAEGLVNMRLIDAVYRSAATGREVRV